MSEEPFIYWVFLGAMSIYQYVIGEPRVGYSGGIIIGNWLANRTILVP